MSDPEKEEPKVEPRPKSEGEIRNDKILALAKKDWNAIHERKQKCIEKIEAMQPKRTELNEELSICDAALNYKSRNP